MVARVGVFDSGVGGLTVAVALHARHPSLDIRYLADTAFFPYGGRDEAEVAERALFLAGQLVEDGAQILVVACNTASSAALELLRERFDLPIVGMEPPLKPAIEASRSHTVAVLATPGTVQGDRLQRLHDRYAGGATVFAIPMPGLADLVEAGEADSERVEVMLRAALEEPLAEGADALALGCTHYEFTRPALARLLPPEVTVIDASEPVARRTLFIINELGLEVDDGEFRSIRAFATGDLEAFAGTIERLRQAGTRLPEIKIGRPVG